MKIVVCGKIGAGKTTATKILRAMTGIQSVDADDIARNLYRKNSDIKRKVENKIGMKIFDDFNILKRDFVRKEFSQNPELIKKIEKIIHPLVEKELVQRFKKNKNLFIEIPIYLEKVFKLANKVIEIRTSKSLRKNRCGFEEDFFYIMDSRQKNDFGGDFVVNNDGDKKELEKKLIDIVKCLQKE